MSSLIVGGTVIPVAVSSPAWSRSDAVDRGRLFDGTFFASESGGAARDWNFSTPPVTQTLADTYIAALSSPAAKLCSGDILQIPTMCSPELIGGKPTRAAASNMVVLDFALHEVQPAKMLLKYAPGDTITGESFSRSTTATYVDSAGAYQSAAINVKRDSHYIGGVRSILLEPSSSNQALQSDALGNASWTKTSASATSAIGTYAGVSFSALTVLGASSTVKQSVTLTGNTAKAVSILVKADAAVTGFGFFSLFDDTAATLRLLIKYTVAAGGTITAVAQGFGTLLGVDLISATDKVYRIRARSNSVVAANSNTLYAYDGEGAATLTSILVAGVQIENGASCTSRIPTTTTAVTRGADSYSIPFTTPPQEMTVFAKFVELGTILTSDTAIAAISSAAAAAPLLEMYDNAGFYATFHHNGVGGVTSSLATAPVYGDVVELASRLYGDGSDDIAQSINSGAATTSTQSAVPTPTATGSPFAAAWSGQLLWLNSAGTVASTIGTTALQSLKIVAGARSLSEMRAA